MANLPSEKNDRENVKGWREQLNDLRPLLSTDISAENKTAVKAGISEASRGHVEIVMQNEHITAEVTPSHEINTSGVRDTLREDMKEMNFDILQEKQILPVDTSMPPGEVKVFETVMNQGFMDERITPAENDPELSAGQEIREKLKNAAASLHKNSKNLDQESMRKLDLALTDLSQRIENAINAGGPALEEDLKKLSDEVATVGTKEWEKRFVGNGNTRSFVPEIPEKANPADALGGHILNEAIDAIEKKLNTAVVTVEMAFRNNAFDEKRMEKFHSVALDIAERIQKVIDERSAYSTEHTLKRLEELSAEIPLIEEENLVIKKRTVSLGEGNDTSEKQASENVVSADESAVKVEESVIPKGDSSSASEENGESGAKETTLEKEAEIDTEIEAQFQKDFALAEEDLKNLTAEVGDGAEKKTVRFSDLTPGRQILLLENLKDFALDNAKEQALKQFTEEEKKKFADSGLLKKMWLGATKTFRRAHDISATERHSLLKPEESKEVYREVLQEMLGMAAYAPDAERKEGKLQVNFAMAEDFPGLDFGKPEIAEKLKNFNDVAGNFARVPSEYAYSKDEKQRAQYEEAKKTYADARGELLVLRATSENEDGALAYIADIDKKIHFSRLFNANPETETAFAEIVGKKYANLEGLKAFLGERGRLLAGGMVIRTIGMIGAAEITLGFGMSLAGAPLLAAVGFGAGIGAVSGGLIGRYMAGKRVRQEISDKKKLGEMGVTDAGNEKDFRAAHEEKEGIEIGAGLTDKLDYALTRVEEADAAGDGEKKQQVLKVLADRLYYTEQKIAEGLVNFGEGSAGFKNEYELNLALAKARVFVEMNEPDMERKINVRIEEELKHTPTMRMIATTEAEKIIDVKGKVDALLGEQIEKIKEAEEDFKKKKIAQGMKYGIFLGGVFGGGFAGLGHVAHGGGSGGNAPTEANAAVVFSAKPSLADEVLAKMNPSKILPNEEAAVQPERIPDIGPLPKEVLPASTTDVAPTQSEVATMIIAPPSEKFPADWPAEVKGAQGTQSGVELLSPRKISIENSFEELGKTYTVKTGDNVWNIIKAKLGDNENFAKLPPREQNFILDSIKDKIVKMSPKELQEIGIKSDPNRVYPGDELKLGKVFHSSDDLLKIFNRAADSAPATEQHAIVPPAAEPTPAIPPSAEEPPILAQNENITADVTAPLQSESIASDIHHEILAPTGGHSEVFLTRAEDIPSYADYKIMVYDEIHLRHPNIERSLYDMRLKDFLAGDPNGLEDLKRVFHMQGVQTPKILPQETLNGSVLDWWTRQVVQDDFNRHGGSIAPGSSTPIRENEISRHLSESAMRTRESVYRSETENPKMTQTNTANVSAVTKKIYKIFDNDTRPS